MNGKYSQTLEQELTNNGRKVDPIDEESACDFEAAISATGFGKFNIILYLTASLAVWASFTETTAMSYVVLVAQDDLDLTLGNKGLLNAVPYLGMISSGFLWGYLSDSLGRKKLIVVGFLLEALTCAVCAFSQSFQYLMIVKFFGGLIVNGPYSVVMSYLSEFHTTRHRPKMQLLVGFYNALSSILLPLLAFAVLPLDLENYFNLFGFHSWNLFILLCSIPTLLSGLIFIFLPESPKFLMTRGDNDKSLEVFQQVYHLNTGNSKATFKVRKLVDERRAKPIGGWQQIKPLFLPPNLRNIFLVCLIQMLNMMSGNVLRLWTPQILQAVEYSRQYGTGSEKYCEALTSLGHNRTETDYDAIDNASSFLNSIYVALPSLVFTALSGIFINYLGRRTLLCFFAFASGFMVFGLYFSRTNLQTILMTAVSIGLNTCSTHTVIAVVVDLFPTSLRTMAVASTMIVGRIGVIFGNVVFPYLLVAECAVPLSTLGAILIGSFVMVILLPNTDMKPLQ